MLSNNPPRKKRKLSNIKQWEYCWSVCGSGIQEGTAEQFWLRSLMEMQSNTLRAAPSAVVRLGLKDALPRSLTHVIQVDMAISQFLLFWIFPQNYLRVLPSWWLASLRARSWREQDRSYSTFYDPALEVTLSLPPYSIGHKSQPWLSVRDHTGATLLGNMDHAKHWRKFWTFLPTRCHELSSLYVLHNIGNG